MKLFIDTIITLNVKDFKSKTLQIPVYTPQQFVEFYNIS